MNWLIWWHKGCPASERGGSCHPLVIPSTPGAPAGMCGLPRVCGESSPPVYVCGESVSTRGGGRQFGGFFCR